MELVEKIAHVIGAGLAGSEAAYQLAKRDIKVKLSLGENLLELADLFQYDDIEYLTGVHEVEKNEYNDTIELLYNSFLGLKVGKIKTLNEYLL